MDATSYTLVFSGLALDVCLLWRLARQGMWHRYAFLSLYVAFVVIRTCALFATVLAVPDRFATYYWMTETVSLLVRFLVVWEVFRQTFPKGSSLSRIASKGFVVAGFGLAVFLVDAFWAFKAYAVFNSVYLALDRSFGFACAVLTLGLMLVARYYGVPIGRNVWGIALGFGGWTSIITANNAMFDLDHSFIPFWRFVNPLSSMVMLGIWIWALWDYAPNPAIEAEGAGASELSAWTDEWDRTVSSTRRVIHP